jgi:ankyrin repeat protein
MWYYQVNASAPGYGRTAFHNACYQNHPECAEALVRAGCDVRIKDKRGETGRQLAERHQSTAVVARLRALVAEQLKAAQVGVDVEVIKC